MEEEGFLDRATPEAVVARLKADGTFDKLRKMVLDELEKTVKRPLPTHSDQAQSNPPLIFIFFSLVRFF